MARRAFRRRAGNLRALGTEIERELFRILRNFARYAAIKGEVDFPFPIQHVGDRLGVSFQYVSKLRQRFVNASIIVQTEPRLLIVRPLGSAGVYHQIRGNKGS